MCLMFSPNSLRLWIGKKYTKEMVNATCCIISESIWPQNDLLWMIFTLITWLRWCLLVCSLFLPFYNLLIRSQLHRPAPLKKRCIKLYLLEKGVSQHLWPYKKTTRIASQLMGRYFANIVFFLNAHWF